MSYSNSNEFANDIQKNNEKGNASFHMATVSFIDGDLIYLTFYGEENQRVKNYKRLASYSPTVGDTVICAKLNNTYTILGKVV